MFKLLSEETREQVAREYKLRRSVLALVATIAVCLIALVGLFPSYVLSKARQAEITVKASALGVDGEDSRNQELLAWLADASIKIRSLAPIVNKNSPSLNMEQAIERRGQGIQITQLVWSKASGGPSLSITGVARDRQALLSFENRLNDSGYFSEVTLPVSNLAKEFNISFQVQLSPNN